MTNFDKQNYTIIKQALEPDIAKFLFNYFMMKRQVVKTFIDTKYISAYNFDHGQFGDVQVPQSYSVYGDIAMETLLLKTQSVMEKQTGLNLIPTYSYARAYENGDILDRHKDRYSCEISTTMNLGGDLWPIFLEPSGEKDKEGIKITLEPGDMLVYKGDKCEHWRESFKGQNCVQVFLHYNNADMTDAETNMYDTRPHLGLPSYFKGLKID
tara:strand:- start:109 stop:741 length:633 start_codon:yes stop_codon:yes gene_type:complete